MDSPSVADVVSPLARMRRRWPLVLGALATALVIAGVSSAVYLSHYQPLALGSSGGHEGTTYRQGAPFTYAVSLHNTGRLPITVTGVDTGDPGASSLLRTTGIYVVPGVSIASWGKNLVPNLDRPFPSFALAPGEERNLLVKSVFEGCRDWASGTSDDVVAVHVSFRVEGFSREAWVSDPGSSLFSISPPDRCPEPQP